LLWEYQGEKQRIKMLKRLRSRNPILDQLNSKAEQAKDELKNKLYYRLLTNEDLKRNIRKGNVSSLYNHSELSKRMGIDPSYYKSQYDYLSTYVHSTSYSISQLKIFRPNKTESLKLVETILFLVTGYMCFAVNDFKNLLEEANLVLNNMTIELINKWKDIFSNVNSN